MYIQGVNWIAQWLIYDLGLSPSINECIEIRSVKQLWQNASVSQGYFGDSAGLSLNQGIWGWPKQQRNNPPKRQGCIPSGCRKVNYV